MSSKVRASHNKKPRRKAWKNPRTIKKGVVRIEINDKVDRGVVDININSNNKMETSQRKENRGNSIEKNTDLDLQSRTGKSES